MPNAQSPLSSKKTNTIAIIGAGFCGTMAAVHLLRAKSPTPLRIILINRPQKNVQTQGLARGLAYGTNSATHLLNVPAARMSAFADQPDDFLNFLHANKIDADGASFVARRHYGAYLQKTLDDAVAASHHTFEVRHQTVHAIEVAGARYQYQQHQLDVGNGEIIYADRVVLALGNFLPANPPFIDAVLQASPHYIRDPWDSGALDGIDITKPILLIGTGLTMCDVVLSLKSRADAARMPLQPPLQLYAMSRRGLWPQPHREHAAAPTFDSAPPDIFNLATARGYLHAVRTHVRQMADVGHDWRDVIASLRPLTPALWRALPAIEQKRFLRHVKPYWESHRHRAAPEIYKLIAACAERGEIVSISARILGSVIGENLKAVRGELVEPHAPQQNQPLQPLTKQPFDKLRMNGGLLEDSVNDNAISVRYRRRYSTTIEEIRVASIINCTGPSSDLTAEPLLADLQTKGVITADALNLGLEVADDYRVASTSNNVRGIYYVGPMLKARDWEATAVPELREHVAACVAAILKDLAGK
jgi:uncharacterized NAD(P)/FAD-binding protein YdhS